MKLWTLLNIVFCLVWSVAGADDEVQTLPLCTLQCMEIFIPQSPCSLTDQYCVCNNDVLMSNLTTCVKSTCSVREELTTLNITARICDWPVHNRQTLLRECTIAFFIAATFFVVARITARLRVFGGQFGADDYMISVSYLLALGASTIVLMLSSTGLGKDIWDVPFSASDDQVTYTLKLYTVLEKAYILAIWCTKMSILLLYLRIFPDCKFRLGVKLCLAFCASTVFCLFWAGVFSCWPISYGWTYWDGEHHGSCSNENAQAWVNAALNIVSDLVVLFMPLPTIWGMTVSRGKRVGIMLMFGVGIIITIISMIRLYTIRLFSLSSNPTWDFVDLSLWSVVEVDMGIICACLPGTRNFYRRVIYGRVLGRGTLIRNTTRTNTTLSFEPQFLEKGQKETQTNKSTVSSSSGPKSSIQNQISPSIKSVPMTNDIAAEEKRLSSSSERSEWSQQAHIVEEWPTRYSGLR